MMHWFYADPTDIDIAKAEIILSEAASHHANSVLRLKQGEKVTVSDQTMSVFCGEIDRIFNRRVYVKIIDERPLELPDISFSLYQSLPKSDKMDFIVQKSTELGVDRIIPFTSQRTIIKLDDAKVETRARRWRLISKDAASLAFRDRAPSIDVLVTFAEMLSMAAISELALAFWEERPQALPELLLNYSKPKTIAVIIGPEGGFSSEEVEMMKEQGIKPVSMGRYVFRSETAGMAALAMLQYHFRNLFF